MRTESVAESFETYRVRVLPADAPPVQVNECRRAFYAGAYFLLMNVAYNIGDDSTSEDQGIEELAKLKAECEAFGAAGGLPLPTPTPPPSVLPVIDHRYTTPNAVEIRPLLQDLGGRIAAALPTGWGYNLLLFEYDGGSVFYISSAEREDVIALMRDFIRRTAQ